MWPLIIALVFFPQADAAATYQEQGTNPAYSIRLEFPETSDGAFNAAVRGLIDRKLAWFHDTLRNWHPALPVDSTLISQYDLAEVHQITTMLLKFEWYLAGSAHPAHELVCLNFDERNKRALNFSDLFIPNTDYIAFLSQFALADLTRQMKEGTYFSNPDMIEQGTAPKPQNFQCFTLTPNALVLHFQEYQVGPYVSGPAKVVVPIAVIRHLLSPAVLALLEN